MKRQTFVIDTHGNVTVKDVCGMGMSCQQATADIEKLLKTNLEFIDFYVRYIGRQSNREWSTKQAKFINSIYRSIPKKITFAK